jgi:hypothetical protein
MQKKLSQYFEFSMDLSADKTLSIYEGRVKYILVLTDDRLKLQLPAASFRPYVSETGIQGRFRVKTDARHRLQKLVKL